MSATIHEFEKKQDAPPVQHDVMTEEDGVTRSYDPATGELVGESRQDGMRELEEAMRKARIAQVDWAKRPVKERAQYILRVRDYIVANADRLAQIISRDNGKTRTDALATELLPATMAASYYASHAEEFLAPERLAPGHERELLRIADNRHASGPEIDMAFKRALKSVAGLKRQRFTAGSRRNRGAGACQLHDPKACTLIVCQAVLPLPEITLLTQPCLSLRPQPADRRFGWRFRFCRPVEPGLSSKANLLLDWHPGQNSQPDPA